MANVLIITRGTWGDLIPFLSIASTLKARGHSITLLTHCHYADLIKQNDLNFKELDSIHQFKQFIEDGPLLNHPQTLPTFFRRHLLPKTLSEYELITSICSGEQETVLIMRHMSSLAAPMVAEQLHLPLIRVFTAPSQIVMLPLLEALCREVLATEINHLRTELTLSPISNWQNWLEYPQLSIALWPAWFAATTSVWSSNIVPVGFIMHDKTEIGELPQEALDILTQEKPPVLITGGTGVFLGTKFYQISTQACQLLQCPTILVTPYRELVPDPLPHGVTWFKHLPFATLMPHLQAVIHHGGTSTVARALAVGIPQLALAAGGDRPDTAAHLARLGTATYLPSSRWQPPAIAEALRQLISTPSVQSRCQVLAKRMKETDPAIIACLEIETFLQRKTVPANFTPNVQNSSHHPDTLKNTSKDNPQLHLEQLSSERRALLVAQLRLKKTLMESSGASPHLSDEPENKANSVYNTLQDLSPIKKALLAQRLLNKDKKDYKNKLIPRRKFSNLYPLSFAQERLWFLHQLEPRSPFYNESFSQRLEGSLNVAALEWSFNEIIRRHEILRTTFHIHDGHPIQKILEQNLLNLEVIDFCTLDAQERESIVPHLLRQLVRLPFDLEKGPLFRVGLLRLERQIHVLIVTTHHIVADHWSFSIFFHELSKLYEAFCLQISSPLPILPIQYADFAVWQREWLSGSSLVMQISYWKNKLAGASTVLDLPSDYPRSTIHTFQGAMQSKSLSRSLTQSLKNLSRHEEATLFMTMMAAFQTLLYRYSGQSDILVGTPVPGRPRQETQALIGFFLNMLVIRTQFSDNLTFQSLLKQVRETILGALAHQDLPFDQLVEKLQPFRDLTRNPLFQVTLTSLNMKIEMLELMNLTLHPQNTDLGVTKFDLDLYLEEIEGELKTIITYNIALFKSSTITRLLTHFEQLLEAIVANPAQRLTDLPILNAIEQNQILIDWNKTQAYHLPEICLQDLIGKQAQDTPHAIAVAYEWKQLTFGELDRRSNQLAHYLLQLGVGPDVRVGVYLPRSLDLVVALLAVLKAGGTYVPLDPIYPKQRLLHMFQDALIAILLTQEPLLPSLPASNISTLCLDKDWLLIGRQPLYPPNTQCNSYNLAYVLYTSGSAGVPKGVAVTHENIVAFMNWVRITYSASELSNVLASSSICFDISVFELFAPLCWGGRVILAQSLLHFSTIPYIEEVTLINTTPSSITAVLMQRNLPASVQTINLAGEVLSPKLVQQIFQQSAVEHVYNLYGPTECTIFSTIASIEENTLSCPIGRPITSTQIYILDKHFQLAPIGAVGEIYIGGEGLARGYFNHSDWTAERFLPHPYSSKTGSRLYKTGDIARYNADGNIEYLGRRDQQIKLRGFRIELGEIEASLDEYPGVHACVAGLLKNEKKDNQLIVYLVTDHQIGISLSSVRSFLRERLPDYMLPNHVVFLDTFPLNENGKIDRQALSALYQPYISEVYVPPRTILEVQLQQIWEETLAQRPISIVDDFFDIGGHSILAIHLLAQIHKHFKSDLTLSTFFQHATIEEIATILEQQN